MHFIPVEEGHYLNKLSFKYKQHFISTELHQMLQTDTIYAAFMSPGDIPFQHH